MTRDEYEKLPPEEKEHFATCSECGAIFDRRSLDEVLFHQFRRLEAQACAGFEARRLSLRVLRCAGTASPPQTVRSPQHRQRANRMACISMQTLSRETARALANLRQC